MTNEPCTRERLLAAAVDVIRAKGYNATRVDDLAASAGVTKGSFFHHFASKEACAREAVDHWTHRAQAVFRDFSGSPTENPGERILAYVDFRIALLTGAVAEYSCYVGGLLQEVHETHPDLADACAGSMLLHADTLKPDLAAALRLDAGEARDLALHIHACIQGALLLARAQGGAGGAKASLKHLRRYLTLRMEEATNDSR